MKIFFLTIAVVSLLGCGGSNQREYRSKEFPVTVATQQKPLSVKDLSKDPSEYNAAMLVGFDDGGNLPNISDSRINKVSLLIDEVSTQTNESPTEIAASIDSTADFIKSNYAKDVSRHQLLDDAKTMIAKGDKKAMAGQKFNDLIRLWTLLKYGKR